MALVIPRARFTLHTKALTEHEGPAFLAGAVIDGWYAKSLRGGDKDGLASWSEGDIVTFLKTGSTAGSAAFGDMAEVVEHSTQYLTDYDLTAIARYLKSLPPQPGRAGRGRGPASRGGVAAGARYAYEEFCATCHRANGVGAAHIFPALAGNDVVETGNATSLIHIVLSGGRRPSTAEQPDAFAMPGFRHVGRPHGRRDYCVHSRRLGQFSRQR